MKPHYIIVRFVLVELLEQQPVLLTALVNGVVQQKKTVQVNVAVAQLLMSVAFVKEMVSSKSVDVVLMEL